MALPPLPMVSPHARRSLASSPQSTTGYSKSADQIWGGLVSDTYPPSPRFHALCRAPPTCHGAMVGVDCSRSGMETVV